MPLRKLVLFFFTKALSSLKFTHQNAGKCSSEYSCMPWDPPRQTSRLQRSSV